MDLAFVFLFVVLGAGAIVYAGMRNPPRRPEPPAGDDAGNDPSMADGAPANGGNDDRG